MTCNGHIMPFRNFNATSIDYIYALRGEDIFFLMEAIWMRFTFANYDYTQTSQLGAGMDNAIRAQRLVDMRSAVMSMSRRWQSTAPTVVAHDFGNTPPDQDNDEVEEYLLGLISGFTPACSVDSSYQQLSYRQILRLLTDVKTMCYGVDTTHQIGVSIQQQISRHDHWYYNGTWRDEDSTRNLIWQSELDEGYYDTNTLYTASVVTTNSSQLEATIYQSDNWIYVADILPCILFYVWNSWSWYNNTTHQSDGGTGNEHWVLVPIADTYIDISNGGSITSSLRPVSDIIDDIYQTTGLCKDASDIVFGSTPVRQGEWGWNKISYATVATSYYQQNLVYVKYCNLEHTNL